MKLFSSDPGTHLASSYGISTYLAVKKIGDSNENITIEKQKRYEGYRNRN
jgi:hypothetical protein